MTAECPAQRIAPIANLRVDHCFDLIDIRDSLDPLVECVHDSMVLVYPAL
jgi:hypothetical protein